MPCFALSLSLFRWARKRRGQGWVTDAELKKMKEKKGCGYGEEEEGEWLQPCFWVLLGLLLSNQREQERRKWGGE